MSILSVQCKYYMRASYFTSLPNSSFGVLTSEIWNWRRQEDLRMVQIRTPWTLWISRLKKVAEGKHADHADYAWACRACSRHIVKNTHTLHRRKRHGSSQGSFLPVPKLPFSSAKQLLKSLINRWSTSRLQLFTSIFWKTSLNIHIRTKLLGHLQS